MFLPILLPLAAFILLFRAFLHRGDSTREALLRAAVVSVTILVTLTELLSIPYLITRASLIAAWSIVDTVIVVFLLYSFRRIAPPPRPASRPAVHLPSHLAPVDLFLAAAITLILAIIGVVAIIAPPNTSDVVEYHLPRVLFWVSNHTVRNFPTPDYAHIIQTPGAEFIHLHTYLLFGSDRLANMVEFVSLIGSALAASLIAAKFGARRTGQLLAALFVVTIPEAVLESSGAMTTLVASFWIAAACYFTIRSVNTNRPIDLLTTALACGLALFTKGTSFIFLPFVVLGAILFRPAPRSTWMFQRLPLVILIALAVNAGQFVRAWQITGTPLGTPFPDGGPRLHFGNDRITPGAIAASVVRHATLHLGTSSDKLNARVESLARRAIRLTGNDPDDPASVWIGYQFHVAHATRLETQAGNLLHFLLAILTLAALPFALRKLDPENRSLLWLGLGVAVAFIAFCAVIRWQPWAGRFHLPCFILAAAPFGLLAELLLTRRWLLACLSALLFVNALPFLFSNSIRSIIPTRGFPTIYLPRAELYFGDHHQSLASEQLALALAIRASRCGHIAFNAYLPLPDNQIQDGPPAFWIYPLLAQLQIDGRDRTVRYINVQNSTRKFAATQPDAPACAIICLDCLASHGAKSDANLGPTQDFGDSQLTLLATAHER